MRTKLHENFEISKRVIMKKVFLQRKDSLFVRFLLKVQLFFVWKYKKKKEKLDFFCQTAFITRQRASDKKPACFLKLQAGFLLNSGALFGEKQAADFYSFTTFPITTPLLL
jgi:hypothetical protein